MAFAVFNLNNSSIYTGWTFSNPRLYSTNNLKMDSPTDLSFSNSAMDRISAYRHFDTVMQKAQAKNSLLKNKDQEKRFPCGFLSIVLSK